MQAKRARTWRPAMGARFEGSRRAHPAACLRTSGRTSGFVRAGDPREGSSVLAAAALGEPCCESAALRAELVPTQRFALVRRSPRWAAHPGGEPKHRIAVVGPGGCCGPRGTTKRRQGPPRACIRSSCFGRESVGRGRGACAAAAAAVRARQRVRPPVPLTPLAICASQIARRRPPRCGSMRARFRPSRRYSISTQLGEPISCP